MRLCLLSGLIPLLFAPLFASAQTFEVTDRVSDATGVRRIASADLRPLPSSSYPGEHATFRAVYEKDPNDGETWSLTIFGYASDTTGLGRASTAQLQVDGTAVEPLRVESKTRRLDASLIEIKQIVLRKSAFAQIAEADSATVSIGPARFPMSRVLRTDLRLIRDRAAGPSSSPMQASQGEATDTSTTDEANR